jgi:hypothetical protein
MHCNALLPDGRPIRARIPLTVDEQLERGELAAHGRLDQCF